MLIISIFDSQYLKTFFKVFEVDKEGTLAEWEGVVLLDFVDENRLVAAHDSVAYDF